MNRTGLYCRKDRVRFCGIDVCCILIIQALQHKKNPLEE